MIRRENQIIIYSVLAAASFWLMDAVLDYYFGPMESFPKVLIPWGPELIFRLLASTGFLVFGCLVSRAFHRLRLSEERLRREIRDRNWTEDALLASEEKYRSLVESAEDSIYLVDREYRYLFMNRKHLTRINAPLKDILGQPYSRFHSKEETSFFNNNIDKVFEAGQPIEVEHKSERDGNYFLQTMSPVKDLTGKVTAVTVVSKLITDRKRMEDRLRIMSLTDDLTGLYNRRGFFALAEQQLKLSIRLKKKMFLIYTDLDNLKTINDEWGHQEGDVALIETAKLLRDTFRDSDIVARIGGDEFVALPIADNEHDALLVVDRLRKNLEAANLTHEHPYNLSISIGMPAFDPEHPCSLDRLLAVGDDMMYEEKKKKRTARNQEGNVSNKS